MSADLLVGYTLLSIILREQLFIMFLDLSILCFLFHLVLYAKTLNLYLICKTERYVMQLLNCVPFWDQQLL